MSAKSAAVHAFIPRESNNNKARVLHTPVLVLLLAAFIFFQKSVVVNVSIPAPRILGYASQISTSEVIKLTNQKRQSEGLDILAESELLNSAAKLKGQDMLAKGYWAHVSPDGTQPWDFFKVVGYKYKYAGENLARDFTNPASTVQAWMESTSHRENLLSPHYAEIGVAVVEGNLAGKDTTIVVQLFGSTVANSPQMSNSSTQTKAASVAAQIDQAAPVPVAQVNVQNKEPIITTDAVSTTAAAPKILSLVVISFLLGAVIVDAFVLWMRGRHRSSSSPLAHIAFFGMIVTLILVAKAGQIL